MKQKLICLLLACLMLTGILSACATEEANEMTAVPIGTMESTETTAASEATDTTEEKRSAPVEANGAPTESASQTLTESIATSTTLFFTSAQPSDTTAETTQPTADQRGQAMGCIGCPISTLYSVIGSPNSSSYANSCNGDGEDGELYYNGFTVYTYRENGAETVVDVY